jgi:hypothetical protein
LDVGEQPIDQRAGEARHGCWAKPNSDIDLLTEDRPSALGYLKYERLFQLFAKASVHDLRLHAEAARYFIQWLNQLQRCR